MAGVDRVRLPGELSLSRIVYGTWRLAEDADTSPERVRAKLEACLDQGITTIDQADIYGGYTAEAILGAALKQGGLRERLEIVTKCDIVAPTGRHAKARVKHYDTSRAHIHASVDHSLEQMAIDHIDLLLLHRPDPLMDHHETAAALDELVAAGKVRALGVSNFQPHDWSLLASALKTPLATNQIEISLVRPQPFGNGEIAFLQERGVAPMAWSPLGGGGLVVPASANPLTTALVKAAKEAGTDIASVAVAWLLAHPAGILPVLGTNTLERIRGLSAACDVAMDRQTWFELYTAALGAEVP